MSYESRDRLVSICASIAFGAWWVWAGWWINKLA